ncbi:amidohydrolase [Microbacterium sp.]|uniref:amidohydrolase n=1 Tax=Microbacterium sp. TaxID=51671 RepID=UPI0039E62BB0
MAATYFHGGTVWLGAGVEPADALIVADGVIVAVGADAARLAAEYALDTVDLDGGFLMPSFGDGHAHPLLGGLEAEGPDVRSCASVDEIVAEVRRHAETHPDLEWIQGASYDGSLSPGGLFDAQWLDAAVPDRPVVLRAWDYHTAWCNSEALQRAGITSATPDPVLGEIPRRPDGEPLGTLREWGAVDLALGACPPRGEEVRLRALQRAAEYYLARGVTWVQDAWVEPDDVDTYVEASRRGILNLRVNLALYADPRRFDAQLPGMIEARGRVEALGDPLLSARTVKFFADGVIENETGALLEPYCSGLHDHGMRVWEGDSLAEAVRAVDAAGFQIHIHAIGDAAVRQGLDAIEHAARCNGPRDRRPVVAHVQLVDDADLSRFAALGVIACMQPLWAQQDSLMTVLTTPRLGQERSDRQYRIRSLLDDGALLSFGSDWPVSSGAPLDGLAVATSRQTSDGVPDGGWIPAEIVDVPRAIDAYSAAVAHQAFADGGSAPRGRIAAGATADLVWLAHDPRDLGPGVFAANPVRATFLAGTVAYKNVAAASAPTR